VDNRLVVVNLCVALSRRGDACGFLGGILDGVEEGERGLAASHKLGLAGWGRGRPHVGIGVVEVCSGWVSGRLVVGLVRRLAKKNVLVKQLCGLFLETGNTRSELENLIALCATLCLELTNTRLELEILLDQDLKLVVIERWTTVERGKRRRKEM
jgi:hypothetical protein